MMDDLIRDIQDKLSWSMLFADVIILIDEKWFEILIKPRAMRQHVVVGNFEQVMLRQIYDVHFM